LLGFYLLIFTGLVIGGLFLAPLTDKFGMKRPLAIAVSLMILLYTLIIIADSYTKLHYYMLVYGILLAVIIVSGILLML
jgi:MFS family permease